MRFWVLLLLSVVLAVSGFEIRGEDQPAQPSSEAVEDQPADEADARKELLTGQVKFLGPALRNRGIKAYEEMDKQVVLITDEGELVPLVADWRGRAFYQDERLRDRKVPLVVRRSPGISYRQVLIVYTIDKNGQRMYTDYWCDICSIPMYEIKDCECCQGPIRLRFQDRPLPSYLAKEIGTDTNTNPEDAQDEEDSPSKDKSR